MKKSIFVFAIILAGVLTSCGDTNYCYELTTKVTILGVTTTTVSYVWGTANEIEVTKEELKMLNSIWVFRKIVLPLQPNAPTRVRRIAENKSLQSISKTSALSFLTMRLYFANDNFLIFLFVVLAYLKKKHYLCTQIAK